MKKIVIAVMGASLMFGGVALARPTFVKGAKCVACHEGSPAKKQFTKMAKIMLKQHKTTECKNCHGPAKGDKPMTMKKR